MSTNFILKPTANSFKIDGYELTQHNQMIQLLLSEGYQIDTVRGYVNSLLQFAQSQLSTDEHELQKIIKEKNDHIASLKLQLESMQQSGSQATAQLNEENTRLREELKQLGIRIEQVGNNPNIVQFSDENMAVIADYHNKIAAAFPENSQAQNIVNAIKLLQTMQKNGDFTFQLNGKTIKL